MAGQTDAMPPQSELFVAPCILATVREWTDCSAVIIPLQMFAQNGMTGGLSSNSTPCVCVCYEYDIKSWTTGGRCSPLVMVVVMNALKKFKQFVNYGFVRKLVAELVYPVHKPTAITAFV